MSVPILVVPVVFGPLLLVLDSQAVAEMRMPVDNIRHFDS
jgi:hypothetical protein